MGISRFECDEPCAIFFFPLASPFVTFVVISLGRGGDLIDDQSVNSFCKIHIMQGSYRSWKTWKVMEFDNLDSRPGKSWNFGPGPGKSWNFMLANLYAAELPTVLDCLTCMREKTLNYGNR